MRVGARRRDSREGHRGLRVWSVPQGGAPRPAERAECGARFEVVLVLHAGGRCLVGFRWVYWRPRLRVASQVVTAAAPTPTFRCRAASGAPHELSGQLISVSAWPFSSRRTAWQCSTWPRCPVLPAIHGNSAPRSMAACVARSTAAPARSAEVSGLGAPAQQRDTHPPDRRAGATDYRPPLRTCRARRGPRRRTRHEPGLGGSPEPLRVGSATRQRPAFCHRQNTGPTGLDDPYSPVS